jgi:hypothetical protein
VLQCLSADNILGSTQPAYKTIKIAMKKVQGPEDTLIAYKTIKIVMKKVQGPEDTLIFFILSRYKQ